MKTLIVCGLRLGVQLALMFLVARYLGPSQFGEFAGIAALAVGLGTLSSFGLGFLVLGESARSAERGYALLTQAASVTWLSAFLLGGLYFWLCRSVLGSEASIRALVMVACSDFLLMPWLGLISNRIHGLGQVARSQMIVLLPISLRLLGVGACVMFAPSAGLELYAIVYVVGALAGLCLSSILAGKNVAGFLRPGRPESGTLRQGAGYALMNFMAVNPGEIDKALALRMISPSDAGIYALASRGMSVVTLPVVAMVLSAQPRIFQQADSRTQSSSRLVAILLIVSLGYGLIAACVLHFLAPPALQLAFGRQYTDIGKVVEAIAFVAPFMSLRFATGGILLALGRPIWRAGIEGFALLIFIGLALMLAPRYNTLGLIWALFGIEATMGLLGCGALLLDRRARCAIRSVASTPESRRGASLWLP